jgi:hypothetical protein
MREEELIQIMQAAIKVLSADRMYCFQDVDFMDYFNSYYNLKPCNRYMYGDKIQRHNEPDFTYIVVKYMDSVYTGKRFINVGTKIRKTVAEIPCDMIVLIERSDNSYFEYYVDHEFPVTDLQISETDRTTWKKAARVLDLVRLIFTREDVAEFMGFIEWYVHRVQTGRQVYEYDDNLETHERVIGVKICNKFDRESSDDCVEWLVEMLEFRIE